MRSHTRACSLPGELRATEAAEERWFLRRPGRGNRVRLATLAEQLDWWLTYGEPVEVLRFDAWRTWDSRRQRTVVDWLVGPVA
jgi:hypothetical protein